VTVVSQNIFVDKFLIALVTVHKIEFGQMSKAAFRLFQFLPMRLLIFE